MRQKTRQSSSLADLYDWFAFLNGVCLFDFELADVTRFNFESVCKDVRIKVLPEQSDLAIYALMLSTLEAGRPGPHRPPTTPTWHGCSSRGVTR